MEAVKLFFRKSGQGEPLIILHGLFGISDNWTTQARALSEFFTVYAVDCRNHGLSPHSSVWNFDAMSLDLLTLMNDEKITKANLIGHSMGGKICMRFAEQHPERILKMIIADIAPRYYEPHHHQVLTALNAIDFEVIKSRKQAEEVLMQYIHDNATRQFILKNIYWKENGMLAFRFNLPVISKNIESVGESMFDYGVCSVPALFIRGEKSDYINQQDIDDIYNKFIHVQIVTIPNAGHWVHAENPEAFLNAVKEFLQFT